MTRLILQENMETLTFIKYLEEKAQVHSLGPDLEAA